MKQLALLTAVRSLGHEEALVEKKSDELTDQIGFLMLDLLIIRIKKIAREHQVYSNFVEVTLPESERGDPF